MTPDQAKMEADLKAILAALTAKDAAVVIDANRLLTTAAGKISLDMLAELALQGLRPKVAVFGVSYVPKTFTVTVPVTIPASASDPIRAHVQLTLAVEASFQADSELQDPATENPQVTVTVDTDSVMAQPGQQIVTTDWRDEADPRAVPVLAPGKLGDLVADVAKHVGPTYGLMLNQAADILHGRPPRAI